jgi:hypothetical protein
MAIAIAGVTITGVAVGAVGRGATLDTAKIGLATAIETMQSASTIETGRTTGDVARRCARGTMGWKASYRSGRRTSEGRTAGEAWRGTTDEARRRTTGKARRRTSEHGRRSRRGAG